MVVAGSKGSKINISQVCLQKFYPNYYLGQRFKDQLVMEIHVTVKCALLTFTCVSLLGNAYNFLNEINIYKWSGSFLGYCLCGATERRRKANSLWFPSQNFASLHQG